MNIYHKLLFEYESNTEIALLTVTAISGSNPSEVGRMMIIDKNGKVLDGSISGGNIEYEAIEKAVELLNEGTSKPIRIDVKDETGKLCTGTIDIFVQVFAQKDELILIGAGNVGYAMYQIGVMLDYDIIIVDDREEYANKKRFPEAKKIYFGEFKNILKEVAIGKNSNIIIATHGHEFDQLALEAVANSDAKYIGMLSNRRKAKKMLDKLREKGVSESKINSIFTPIGLSIGGSKPVEIALSIMSEIIALKYGKLENFRNDMRE